MKKNYQTPAMKAIKVKMTSIIAATAVQHLEGNASLQMGGAGSGSARGRQDSSWDDDEE